MTEKFERKDDKGAFIRVNTATAFFLPTTFQKTQHNCHHGTQLFKLVPFNQHYIISILVLLRNVQGHSSK